MSRFATLVALAAGAMALTVACEDPSSSSSSSGESSGGPSGADDGGEVPSGVRICPPPELPTACSDEELAPYRACVGAKCDEAYKACFGPDWKRGTFSGACGTYIGCLNECECSDLECRMSCVRDQACTECLQGATCSDACELPRCAGTAPADDESCGALAACCEALSSESDPIYKDQCESGVRVADGDLVKCASILHSFRSNGLCL